MTTEQMDSATLRTASLNDEAAVAALLTTAGLPLEGVHEALPCFVVGRALVTRTIAEAEGRGVKALYLLTTTAEHYFPTFGFTVVSRDSVPDDVKETPEYRGMCPSSATVMVRQFADPSASPD